MKPAWLWKGTEILGDSNPQQRGNLKTQQCWKVLSAHLDILSEISHFGLFFCAILATVVINELDFWNLWEQENGEVAFCSFWFSVSSEKKTFYCLISVSMSTWKVKYSYMKARPVVRG